MEQVKENTYDTLRSAWEQTWSSYASIVEQLKQYGQTAIEKATSEYEAAKTNLSERTTELQNWVVENGHKLKEESSDLQVETAHKLHQARKEAYEKYVLSKDALRRMFLTSQEEAKEDLRNAQEQVRKTSRNVERHIESAADKTSEEFQSTKLKLEEAKTKAEKELEAAKAHISELSGKVSTWTEEVVKILSEQSEILSKRVIQMKDQIVEVASESKEKVEESTAGKVLSEKWNQIYSSLQEESTYALDKLSQFKDSVQGKLEDVLIATGITESLETPPPTPTDKDKTVEQPPISPINVPLA
jgi:DNA repair exonuclease SbcCD ATPase subunit